MESNNTPMCVTCGKPVPYGEYIVFASAGLPAQHKKCVDKMHKLATKGG
jgi:hypothetical protein